MSVPTPPILCAITLGLFALIASVGTIHPAIIQDRYVAQFLPIMRYFTGNEDPWLLARLSQGLIALVELIAGACLIAGVASPARRYYLITAGCSLLIALFAGFMLTLFLVHYAVKGLPHWNQFPALLAFVMFTWYLNVKPEKAG